MTEAEFAIIQFLTKRNKEYGFLSKLKVATNISGFDKLSLTDSCHIESA